MKKLYIAMLTIPLLLMFAPTALAQEESPAPAPTVAPEPTLAPTVAPEPTATPEPNPLPPPPDADGWTLVAILTWLMSGGSGWTVSRLFEDDKAPQWFNDLTPGRKQIVTALSSGLLALLGCLGLLALGGQTAPVGFEQWFNVLAPVFVGAPGVGELIHSRRKVSR